MTGPGEEPLSAEQVIAGLRVIVGVVGFPKRRDHWRLVAYLQCEGRIDVEIRPVKKSFHYTVDGQRRIRIAESLPEPQKARKALEECGHAVLGGTCPVYPPAGRVTERGRHKLLRSASQRQECVACRFMLAWLLPLSLILPYQGRPHALARASGCSLAEIEARWSHLNP